MKLIGSNPSPFVRRIRVLLYQLKQPFEFEVVSILNAEGQARMAQYSPTARIPILIDGPEVIWDSMLISKYLLKKYRHEEISLQQEKDLILVNEANDSAVILFQLRQFKMDENWESQLAQLQLRRFVQLLELFNQQYAQVPEALSLKDMWVYCLLDWLEFRKIYDWRGAWPNLVSFIEHFKHEPGLIATVPLV